MASPRYTLNIKPEEPEEKRVYTAKEKRQNFMHYHKWYFIGGAIVLVFLIFFIHDIMSVEEPDFQIAVITEQTLPEDALTALENEFAAYISDLNGDGDVIMSVVQYNLQISTPEELAALDAEFAGESTAQNSEETDENAAEGESAQSAADLATNANDPYVQMAAVTRFSGDLQAGDSMLFVVEDAELFQSAYSALSYNDGTTPEEGDTSGMENIGKTWQDSAFLSGLDLMVENDAYGNTYNVHDLFEGYTVALRIFEGTAIANDEDKVEAYELATQLFGQM